MTTTPPEYPYGTGTDGRERPAPTETVPTPELRPGDVVLTHGLRVRLGERREWTEHGRTCVAFPGEILNPEYLRTDTGRYSFGGIIPLDGSSGWTIQGNDFATWTRTVTPQV